MISIILLLIAILLPVLSRARDAARLTVCATQMRQIGYGFFAHAASNDDKIAPAFRQTPSGGAWSWDDWLIQDMGASRTRAEKDALGVLDREKGLAILTCPGDQAVKDSPQQAIRSYSMPRSGTVGGILSNIPRGVGVDSPDVHLFRFGGSNIHQASDTLLLVEHSNVAGLGNPNRQGRKYRAAIDGPFRQVGANVHILHGTKKKRIYNYLFVDGHVGAYQPKETLGPNQDFNQPGGFWTRKRGD